MKKFLSLLTVIGFLLSGSVFANDDIPFTIDNEESSKPCTYEAQKDLFEFLINDIDQKLKRLEEITTQRNFIEKCKVREDYDTDDSEGSCLKMFETVISDWIDIHPSQPIDPTFIEDYKDNQKPNF